MTYTLVIKAFEYGTVQIFGNNSNKSTEIHEEINSRLKSENAFHH